MLENSDRQYNMYNVKNEKCQVCVGINNIYRANLFENEFKIPKEIGQGYCRRIIVKPSMEVSICDMTFYEGITTQGRYNYDFYELSFCLGEGFEWIEDGINQEFVVECGDSFILKGLKTNGTFSYIADKRFYGIGIKMSNDMFKGLMDIADVKDILVKKLGDSKILYRSKITSSMKSILHNIIYCRYSENIKKIYLEGKIMELFAVYIDELVLENEVLNSSIRLSKDDVERLHRAKDILNADIVSPPNLSSLAKLVCLNEFKLKKGFKELFGMPVHSYVIDKRLEMAKTLIESQKHRVIEIALIVGYSDASYFAEKFRKKYGINPSEYIKRV